MGTSKRSPARTSGLADALFTRTQQRVLSLIFGQPHRVFLQKELIDRAGSGSGSVRRELDRLTQSGLLIVERVGAQKHYQANRSAPIFDELRGIVMKTVALTDPLKKALWPLKKHIRLALVYGSVARGEDRAQSDIDLLVVADDLPLERLFARLDPVEKMLGRKVNPTTYTSAEYARRRKSATPFLQKVLAREHIVLMGDIDHDVESR